MPEMRALSIRQPWAGCIAHLDMRIANRSCRLPEQHRGRQVAIHAATELDRDNLGAHRRAEAWASLFGSNAEWDAWRFWHLGRTPRDVANWPPKLALGAVVAVAALAGCHRFEWDELCGSSGDWGKRSRHPGLCSPYVALGVEWHWELADVRPLAEPVPCRGLPGLWPLPDDVESAVRGSWGRSMPERIKQLALPFGDPAPGPGPSGPAEFRAGGRVLRVSECFDEYWRFAAERQRIFHRRAAGAAPPWTRDPVLARYKFTNIYRAADRVSQYLITNVIYDGPQDPDELVFRILLFKVFNRIETWELLASRLGETPSWNGYNFAAYNEILSAAMRAGERVYSAAYITPNPPFGEPRKHGNHLRLLEYAMTSGLPARIAAARNLREVYEMLLGLPSVGGFLAYQYAIDLAYSAVTSADESQFVAPGPGALDGISKCFTDTAGMDPAEVITWMRDTSRDHCARLGLDFPDLWGRWPTLIDWQNVFCEVSKYTRVTHPHIRGSADRTRIKQGFRQNPAPIDYRFPPKWGLPPERTAQLTSRPADVQAHRERRCQPGPSEVST